MPRREDLTDEFTAADLPPPASEPGVGEQTVVVEGEDFGAPTELMDRRELLGNLARGRQERAPDASPHSGRTLFGTDPQPGGITGEMDPADLPPMSARTVFTQRPDEEASPHSQRTAFMVSPSPTSQRTELLPRTGSRPSFRELSRPRQVEDEYERTVILDETEHTLTNAEATPNGRRPPAPPPARHVPPVPRRPEGLPAPGTPFRAPPPPLGAPNPFLPPPSKFFQAPVGTGRSKPRESTTGGSQRDVTELSPARAAQRSEIVVDLDPDEEEAVAPAVRPTELELPRNLGAVPAARPPTAFPPGLPPPPRAAASAPKPPPQVPEEPSFDLELEGRLLERQDWNRLVDLYTGPGLRTHAERLDHLLQAATILETRLTDHERAFFAYLDVLVLAPEQPEPALGIERAAAALGVHAKAKWSEAVRRLKKISDQTADPQLRAGHLALLFRWNNQELRRRDIAAEVFTKLSELAPRHPVVLERRANEARARGDARQQEQLLAESLPLWIRTDDRIRVHLALAELYEGPLAARGQALPHYEAVLAEAPDHFDALRGLERALREAGEPARVRDVLERMAEAATNPKDRLEPLIRLAETLEKDLADPDSATSVLEDALAIDPQNQKALAALERCYEALGHWSEVARVMQRRATVLTAPRAKMDLQFAAADVLEKRAYDLEGAFEALQSVLAVDAKNRRALTELRRLAEPLALVDEAVSFGTRLAEATPDKREAARIFAELGQELEDRGDPQLARVNFERALELDRRNKPVLSALERLARAAAADERARHFLEQRARLAEEKLESAELFTQLGRERREAGDGAGALDAYRAAYAADPGQEEAAAALLDWNVEQGNFRAVEPLLDLLTRAARRDGDSVRTLHLLRLATRTAASLGKLEPALHAAMAAFDEAPTDAGARNDLLEVAARTSPDKIGIAREHLARVAEHSDGMSTGGLVRLADSQYAAGDSKRAVASLEQAHDQSPNDVGPLEALEHIFEAEEQWERLAATLIEHARMLPLAEEEEHFRLLCDAGDLFARRLNDVRAASEAFEEARVLRADDTWLLETLAWSYREVAEWTKLVEVLDTLIASSETPAKERELLLELADLHLNELSDPAGALSAFDRVLDGDSTYLQAFEKIVRLLTDARDWSGLEKAYRKMLLRIKNEKNVSLELALWKQVGLVYRDRLGNNQSAREAFQAALQRAPADEELHRIVVELALLLGDLDGAIEQARRRVQHAPFEPQTYQTLYDLFLRKGSYDHAWCALDVMAQLVTLEGDEEELYAGYPPFPLDEIPGTLTEEAWQTHLLDKQMDATLTSLFAWATPAEVRLLEGAGRYLGERPFDQSVSGTGVSLTAIIENGAEILGMVNPPLYHADNADMPLRPASGPPGAFLVDHRSALAETDTLSFHVGRGLSWLRSELMPLAFFANQADLAGFLARLVRQDPDLYFAMTEDERATVSLIIDQATEDGAKLDVKKWLTLAHGSSVRAAVLLAGSVHDAAVFYSRAEDDDLASEKLTAIYQFAVSDEHGELRTAIGTAIAQTS